MSDTDGMSHNDINAWHVIKYQEMDDEGDEGGELIETPYFTKQDAKCQVGDLVVFRPPANIRPYLSNPNCRHTGHVVAVYAGHEIVYVVLLLDAEVFADQYDVDPLFKVSECDIARVVA